MQDSRPKTAYPSMVNCRLVVVSCPRRKPIQEIWLKCQQERWPDCPFPIDILSPEPDVGWNQNLIKHIESFSSEFVLLMLDDNFLHVGPWTMNMFMTITFMENHPDIGMIKLQAGGAAAPELPVYDWPRVREYDRRHHPFKRTNLIPTMYRREWLLKLCSAVLDHCGKRNDIGRNGAIEYEITGTLLTEDSVRFPEKMLGIHRPGIDGSGGDALLDCICNDAVVEGRMRPTEPLTSLCKGVEGIEAFQ